MALDEILPSDVATTEAREVLKKNGFDDELLITNASDQNPMSNALVAEKSSTSEDERVRVTMPIKNGRIIRPFRIDWVQVETGETLHSITTSN